MSRNKEYAAGLRARAQMTPDDTRLAADGSSEEVEEDNEESTDDDIEEAMADHEESQGCPTAKKE